MSELTEPLYTPVGDKALEQNKDTGLLKSTQWTLSRSGPIKVRISGFQSNNNHYIFVANVLVSMLRFTTFDSRFQLTTTGRLIPFTCEFAGVNCLTKRYTPRWKSYRQTIPWPEGRPLTMSSAISTRNVLMSVLGQNRRTSPEIISTLPLSGLLKSVKAWVKYCVCMCVCVYRDIY